MVLIGWCCQQAAEHAARVAALPPEADNGRHWAGREPAVEKFDILRLIPAFGRDSSFHFLQGFVIGNDIQKMVIFSQYRLPKKNIDRHIRLTNQEAQPPGSGGKGSAPGLVALDRKFFFGVVYGDYDKLPAGQYVYKKLSALKKYDLYFASTPGYLHWLFIDADSDTVYQRTQLLVY